MSRSSRSNLAGGLVLTLIGALILAAQLLPGLAVSLPTCSRVHTYSKARRELALLLEQAVKEGEVRVKRRDRQTLL